MENKKKHFWLKEIADSFNMTVSKFAETVGYSRQALYNASSGQINLNKGHVGLIAFKLITISDNILENDIQYARKQHAFRRKLIDDFVKRFIVEEI